MFSGHQEVGCLTVILVVVPEEYFCRPVIDGNSLHYGSVSGTVLSLSGSTDAAPADHLYLKEKEEADEVYRRLLVGAQWSGKPALTTFQEQHACAPDTDDRTGGTFHRRWR